MATTVKLITKGAKGKMITKEINSWSLDQFKAANQITTESAIEITEKMFNEKTPVYFHDGNILIKTTFRASKGDKTSTIIKKHTDEELEIAKEEAARDAIEMFETSESGPVTVRKEKNGVVTIK